MNSRIGALTPIVFVEAIEPCLPFWTEKLGFTRTMEVPDGDRLGFAAVQRDAVEVMYQTYASIGDDIPAMASLARDEASVLFIQVSDVAEVARRLEGEEIVQPMRETFYGSREFSVRAPCGTVVGLAEFSSE